MTNQQKTKVKKTRYKRRIFSGAHLNNRIFKIQSKKLFKSKTKSKVNLSKYVSKQKLCQTCVTNMYTPPHKECWMCRGDYTYTQKTTDFV